MRLFVLRLSHRFSMLDPRKQHVHKTEIKALLVKGEKTVGPDAHCVKPRAG